MIGAFKKNQNTILYLSLASIIFLSGCLESGKTKTEIVSEDMLTIKSIDVFPAKEVQPDNALILRMEVENVGQDSIYLLIDKNSIDNKALAWNGDYLLIDHCPTLYNANTKSTLKDAYFQILSGGTCIPLASMYDPADTAFTTPLIPLVKDSDGIPIGASKDSSGNTITACYLKIPPGQSHTFQWSLKAPSSERIADITQKCTFKFQTAYAAKAITNTYVYFADPIEVAQRLYTKKDMTLVGDNIASYGPIAVNFVPAEPQPIPARTDGKWTIFLNLKNVGEGIANVDSLDLGLPDGVEIIGSKILGCNGLSVVDKNIALVDAMAKFGISKDALFIGALNAYRCSCFDPSCPYKDPTNPYCIENIKQLVIDYDTNLCPGNPDQPGANDLVCSMTFSKVRTALDDTRRLLQINSKTSSRNACELTIPEGVTILNPFRFVTAAEYTYYIRQDIPITTKPIKGSA